MASESEVEVQSESGRLIRAREEEIVRFVTLEVPSFTTRI